MNGEPEGKDNHSQNKPSNDINQAMHTKVDSSYGKRQFQLQDVMYGKLWLNYMQVYLNSQD